MTDAELITEAQELRARMSGRLREQFTAEQVAMLEENARLRAKNERLHARLAALTGEAYQGGSQRPAGMALAGRVVNPGDPDWVPSPKFVPPSGWAIPAGWAYTPAKGWRRVSVNGG